VGLPKLGLRYFRVCGISSPSDLQHVLDKELQVCNVVVVHIYCVKVAIISYLIILFGLFSLSGDS
jgi:hypothetical protein